jgi:hypothetical protein
VAFIITKSKVEDDTFGKLVDIEPKVRYVESDDERARLLKGEGTHFKLYDDDGELYYTGKFLGDADSEEAFEPLDWAGNYAGCTYIKYRQKDGTYAVL